MLACWSMVDGGRSTKGGSTGGWRGRSTKGVSMMDGGRSIEGDSTMDGGR